jgi:hypothetical protein
MHMPPAGLPAPERSAGATLRRALLWVLCTYACIHVLYYLGFEGAWLRLDDALAFRSGPPFNHRVLFVLIGRALRLLRPELGAPATYFATQIVAAAAAFYVIHPLARRFLPERQAVWSRPLLLVLLVPTFTYWTFFDIGIVFFYAAALLALAERRYGWYLAAFAAGTLNHENILLLVPAAVAFRFGTDRFGSRGWLWVLAQLALYAAIRLALFRLLPAPAAWQSGKLAYNLALLSHPQALAKTAIWLFGWGATLLLARRRIPGGLLLAGGILLVEILATSVLFGQFNELRLFDALLPFAVVGVLIAMTGDAPDDGGDALVVRDTSGAGRASAPAVVEP